MKPKITKRDLKKLSDSSVYWRGVEYFRDGLVRELEWDGESYKAIVIGSEEYTVEICEDIEGEVEFYCDCPYDWGGICKHSVAVGLAIIDQQNNQTASKLEKDKKSANANEISQLMMQATQSQKDIFLEKLLRSSVDYQQQFEIYIKGELAVGSKVDLENVRNSLIKRLEKTNLNNKKILYEYAEASGGNVDEWEVLYCGTQALLESYLDKELSEAESLRKNGFNVDCLKMYLAVYEAINLFDSEKVKDDECILESIYDELMQIWVDHFGTIETRFKATELSVETIEGMIELLHERFKAVVTKEVYVFDYFETLILNLISIETLISIEEKIVPLFNNTILCRILIKIAEIKNDSKKWLELTEKYFNIRPEIADSLLDYYKENNKRQEFLSIAKVVFKQWPHLSPKIHTFLTPHDDKEFYLTVLESLILKRQNIDLFKEYYTIAENKSVENLIKNIRYNRWDNLYISILEELKRFEDIRDFFDENLENYTIDNFTLPILNVYPDHCYKKLQTYAENFLVTYVGRRYYRELAKKLMLLLKIGDKTLQREIQEWFNDLLKKYKHRPAMQDEFRNVGIGSIHDPT